MSILYCTAHSDSQDGSRATYSPHVGIGIVAPHGKTASKGPDVFWLTAMLIDSEPVVSVAR